MLVIDCFCYCLMNGANELDKTRDNDRNRDIVVSLVIQYTCLSC